MITTKELARLRAIESAARIVCGSAAAPMLDKLPALAAALDMPGGESETIGTIETWNTFIDVCDPKVRAQFIGREPADKPQIPEIPCVCIAGRCVMFALPANVFCRECEVERFEEYQAAQERAAEPADMTEDSEEWQRYLKRRGSQPMPD